MSDFDQQHILTISILQALLLCCSMLMCSVTWSEATTATDDSAEAVVLGKIVKDQQTAQNQTSIQKNTEIRFSFPFGHTAFMRAAILFSARRYIWDITR